MVRCSRILLTDNNSSLSKSAAQPPEAVASESDFVIILAVLLCALICVVGLIAAARCACRRRSGNNRRAGTNSYPFPPNKGLKKKVLQSFPKFIYTSDAAQVNNLAGCSVSNSVKLAPLTSDCAICLGEFVEGDEIRVLPQCGHGFHVSCIDKWLRSHSSCPSCRQILTLERCQKCGQFPPLSSPSASTSTAARDNNDAELNDSENRISTANNAAAFLP